MTKMKQQTFATPTAASLLESLSLPAKAELTKRQKKPATFEVTAGTVSFRTVLTMVLVVIGFLSGSKRLLGSSPGSISSS